MRTEGRWSIANAHEAALVEIPEHLIEQDHRSVKQRIAVMLGLKQFRNAAIMIAGIELMHRIR